MLDLGLSGHAIDHRIARGRLFVMWRGVYHVGPSCPTRNARFMAAVLACGPEAALSHESAANLWGLRKAGAHPIDVSIPATRKASHKGIQVHRRNPMPPTTTLGPIPLSSPLFTLVDLAATVETDALEAALNEADKRNLIAFDEIEPKLETVPKHPGLGHLRETLNRYTRTDSNLERRFLSLVRKARIQAPTTQQRIGPGRIDFHWPELGLVVETDGLTYHRTPMQQLADRKRDQEHAAAGRTQLRVPNIQLRQTPDDVVRILRAVIGRLAEQR